MTLTTPYSATFYVGDGERKTFPYLFDEVSENFITVIVYNALTGQSSTPTYVVDTDQKQVIFGDDTPAPTADETVCIYRNTPNVQDVPFRTLHGYDAKTLENILSKIVAMIQEIKSNYFTTQVLQGDPWQLDLLSDDDDGATINIDYTAKKLVKGLYFRITDGNLQVSADGSNYITMPKSTDVAEFRQEQTEMPDHTYQYRLQYRVGNTWYYAESNAEATADEAKQIAEEARETANDAKNIADSFDGRLTQAESDASDAKSDASDAKNAVNSHLTDYNNPHQVSKAQVGLGNVDNTADIDKPVIVKSATIPTASADLLGKIYQYVGATSAPYEHGYIYECKEISAGIYGWERIDVQPGGSRGRFLALWNCATGLAESNPPISPYEYKTGDYFIVGTVSSATPAVNYKPDGSSYTIGVASTTVETNEVSVDDTYFFDGTNWKLQSNSNKSVTFANLAGDPYDNANLTTALNAKANNTEVLRNKSTTAAGSFIDARAGTVSYPTTGESVSNTLIIGNGAYSSKADITKAIIIGDDANSNYNYSLTIGCSSSITGDYATAIGINSKAYQYSVSLGYYAKATQQNSIAIGYNARATGLYSCSLGNGTTCSGQRSLTAGYAANCTPNYSVSIGASASIGSNANNSVAFGYGASIGTDSSYSIAIGTNSTINNYCSNSVAIGRSATITQGGACIQIGQGTNSTYGSTQIKNWTLLNSIGIIPEQRLPVSALFATDSPAQIYLIDGMGDYDNDNILEKAILYTGITNSAFTRNQCYKTNVTYSYPMFDCSWTSDSYCKSTSDIIIDQNKLFLKLAELSKQGIENDNFDESYVGGDNSGQTLYFYYNGDSQEWYISFDSDSVETGFNGAPSDITGISDISEFGIYLSPNVSLPTDDSDEEIFDLEYYAPIYCDGYDTNDTAFRIDYMKYMDAMCSHIYGFGVALPDLDTWEYEADETLYAMPVLPRSYYINDDIIFDASWDNNESVWCVYINQIDVGTWSTADLASTFGIYIDSGAEQDVGYISFTWKCARQLSWVQFDPIDTSRYGTTTQINNLQSQINTVSNNAFKRINSSRDMNDMTTEGAYHISAAGCTNIPTAASTSMNFYLFVLNRSGLYIRQMIMCDTVDSSCSHVFVRCKSGGTWTSWEPLLSPSSSSLIADYDTTKKQKLIHNISENTIKWVEDSGGGGSVDIDNSTITKNGSDQLQAVATINANTAVGATNPVYDWVGTLAEYTSQAVATNHPDWVCYITDDQTADAYEAYTKSQSNNLFVDKGHEVIDFQAPTAENNYTWYRKYADGWVEQGGTVENNSSASTTINLPITMSDTHYTVVLGGKYDNNSTIAMFNSKSTNSFVVTCQNYNHTDAARDFDWQVSGMAA